MKKVMHRGILGLWIIDKKYKITSTTFFTLTQTITLFGVILCLNVIFNSIFITPTYAENLTIEMNNNTDSVNIAPTNLSGTFASADIAVFSISTDSSAGYTLSIFASSESTNLKGEDSSFSSITSAISESDFGMKSNVVLNGKWGYKPSKFNSNDNTDFLPSPTLTGDVLDTTNKPNSVPNKYTLTLGARANSETKPGKYENTFIVTIVANISPFTVSYNGNGLYFNDDPNQTTNTIMYDSVAEPAIITKYAHTTNIDDQGIATSTYPTGSIGTSKVITIPGATSINVTLSYSIEENWDYLYVFSGKYDGIITGSQNNPMSANQEYTFTGGNSTTTGSNTTTFTIPGDTITFAFWSDPLTAYYGYYAIVSGEGSSYHRTIARGEYKIPTLTGDQIFYGWSENPNATNGDYASINDILDNLAGINGETKTLYAIWTDSQLLQNISEWRNDLAIGQKIPTRDSRDNEKYWVARLPDGNIWMIENLRLGKNYTDGSLILTPEDTDISSEFNLTGYLSDGKFTYEEYTYNNNNPQWSYNSEFDSGYYNWYTAMGGTIPIQFKTPEAISSICPRGWKIPTLSQVNTIRSLNGLFIGDVSRTTNHEGTFYPGFTLSGYYTDEGATAQNTDGRYWTRTMQSGIDGSVLSVKNGSTGSYYTTKFIGNAIRCVEGGDEYTLIYDANGGIGAPTAENGVLGKDGLQIIISNDEPTREGYVFRGWSEEQNATNASYASGNTITVTNSTNVLYAVWSDKYECKKQYRLQNEYGGYPAYTVESTEELNPDTLCTFSKAEEFYVSQSFSAGVDEAVSGTVTASLDLPRMTYPLSINYNTNHISGVSGAGIYRWGQVVPINANLATDDNIFLGWSQTDGTTGAFEKTTSLSTTFTMGKGSATIYADARPSTVTFDMAFSEAGKAKTNGYYKMQDMSTSICSYVSNGQSSSLIDTRRGNRIYTVGKISDNCWMTQNLDLPGGTTLYSSDTNITEPYYEMRESSSNFSYNRDDNLYNSYSTTCGDNNPCYSYYSFTVATAGTNPTNGGDAPSDICPKGWRLPTDREFSKLAQNGNLANSPFYGVYGGYYDYGSTLYAGGSFGKYWSSTVYEYGSGAAYSLEIGTDNAQYTMLYSIKRGHSIRCIAK